MNNILGIIVIATLFVACNHREQLADAYGTFEVEDVIINAEVSGMLINLAVDKGDAISKNELAAIVDTTQLYLQKKKIVAQQGAISAKLKQVNAGIAAQEQQKENIKVNVNRITKLVESGAATRMQLDEVQGQYKLIEKQILTTKSQIVAIKSEVNVLDVQKELLDDNLSKCYIHSPLKGLVLENYISSGELILAGKPIVKLADLSQLDLRCYLSGDMLSDINLGEEVDVYFDKGKDELGQLKGKVIWIAEEAEFTPKIIQTKEERVKLVYAVKVRVKNNGQLKIGMPGEIRINKTTTK